MSKHRPPQSRSHGPHKNPHSPQASLPARSRGEQLALQGPLGSASPGVAVGGNSPREVKRREAASSWLGVSQVVGGLRAQDCPGAGALAGTSHPRLGVVW